MPTHQGPVLLRRLFVGTGYTNTRTNTYTLREQKPCLEKRGVALVKHGDTHTHKARQHKLPHIHTHKETHIGTREIRTELERRLENVRQNCRAPLNVFWYVKGCTVNTQRAPPAPKILCPKTHMSNANMYSSTH